MENIKTTDDFNSRKREVLDKVIPHFMQPDIYPMPKTSMAECAILLAKSEKDMPSQAYLRKVEHRALGKMRMALLKKFNIGRISDIILGK